MSPLCPLHHISHCGHRCQADIANVILREEMAIRRNTREREQREVFRREAIVEDLAENEDPEECIDDDENWDEDEDNGHIYEQAPPQTQNANANEDFF